MTESTEAEPPDQGGDENSSPLDRLGVLAMQTVAIDDGLEHLEIYTMEGLLTVLWHGPADAERVVACVGGAMGGLLGPDGGLFHRLGRELAPTGIGLIRVGYRRPNDLNLCVHDTVAAMELTARHGAQRFITMGHSFRGCGGGAGRGPPRPAVRPRGGDAGHPVGRL